MVSHRWFNFAVGLFWLTTMVWLVREKILPTFLIGTPPSFRTILADDPETGIASAWEIRCNGRILGVVASRTLRHPDGVSEIHTHVRIDSLPLNELVPSYVRGILNAVDGASLEGLELSADVVSTLLVDPLGIPANLQAKLMLGQPHQSWDNAMSSGAVKVVLTGTVEDNQFVLQVRIPSPEGDIVRTTEVRLPAGGLLSDAFAPQPRLPGLRLGQTWPVPMVSPLQLSGSPLEMLFAEVESQERIEWNGRDVLVHVVALRSDPGADLSHRPPPRGRTWVAEDGLVLRQEALLMSTRWTFERLPANVAWPAAAGVSLDEFVK